MSREKETYWPVRFTTDRLLIREPGEADREAFVRLMTNPDARQFLGGSIAFASHSALELSPLGLTWGSWVIAHGATDQMLGYVSLSYDRSELQLSYAMLPEFVGNGYAREACRAVVEFARTELNEPGIIAITPSGNKPSLALLKDLGFTIRRGFDEFGSQNLMLELPLVS